MDASGITFKGQMFGNVKLADPSAIVGKGEEETKGQSYVFTKSGARDFYKLVGISHGTSKNVSKLSVDRWKEVIAFALENPAPGREQPLILENLTYTLVQLSGSHMGVIAVSQYDDYTALNEKIDKFNELLKSPVSAKTVDDNGVMKVFIRRDQMEVQSEDMTEFIEPMIFIELDIPKGSYKAYDGIIRADNKIILISNPIMETEDFEEFITFDFSREMEMVGFLANKMYNLYKEEVGKGIYLSLREVLEVLKIVGVEVETNDEGVASSISGLEDSSKVISFLQSFGLPFKSIKKLSNLRKSLKHNNLSLDSLLTSLSNDLIDFDRTNVIPSAVAYLMRIYSSREDDTTVIKSEIRT